MGLTVGAGIGEFVGRYDGMGVLLVWPAAVAQSARSVATLFRRIIVAIGPASKTDEGAALWRRNIAASASLVAAPASLVAGSARVPVEGARARAGRAALCVWAARVLPRRRRGRGAGR